MNTLFDTSVLARQVVAERLNHREPIKLEYPFSFVRRAVSQLRLFVQAVARNYRLSSVTIYECQAVLGEC